MPTVNRRYFADGSYLDESANPYEKGTDAYYWFIRSRRNAAAGRTLGNQPGAVKTGKIDDPAQWYESELAAERALDHSGQVADGYQEMIDPRTGAKYYQKALATPANGDFYSRGKQGGAGNATPGLAPDNSWNEADGVDLRTEEQKYYDRDLANFRQSADSEGRYSWYATESNYDPAKPRETRQVNLDELAAAHPQASRDPSLDLYPTGSAYQPKPAYDPTAYDRKAYWNYNHAPDAGFFDTAIRTRDNRSLAARAGNTGYSY